MKNLGRFVPLIGALGGLVLLAVGGTALAGGAAEPKIDPKPVTFKVSTTQSSETPESSTSTEPPPEPEPEPDPIPEPQAVPNNPPPPAPAPAAPPPPAPPPLPPLPQIEIHIPPFVPPVVIDDDDFEFEDD